MKGPRKEGMKGSRKEGRDQGRDQGRKKGQGGLIAPMHPPSERRTFWPYFFPFCRGEPFLGSISQTCHLTKNWREGGRKDLKEGYQERKDGRKEGRKECEETKEGRTDRRTEAWKEGSEGRKEGLAVVGSVC
jgi:hypothetical protein